MSKKDNIARIEKLTKANSDSVTQSRMLDQKLQDSYKFIGVTSKDVDFRHRTLEADFTEWGLQGEYKAVIDALSSISTLYSNMENKPFSGVAKTQEFLNRVSPLRKGVMAQIDSKILSYQNRINNKMSRCKPLDSEKNREIRSFLTGKSAMEVRQLATKNKDIMEAVQSSFEPSLQFGLDEQQIGALNKTFTENRLGSDDFYILGQETNAAELLTEYKTFIQEKFTALDSAREQVEF